MSTQNFTENFNFRDIERNNRYVPVALYFNEHVAHSKRVPVVFLNHGGVSPNTDYSYLANFLASKGYAVVCVQHNVIGDEPHSLQKFNTGVLKETRLPIWELWACNILFVIKALGKIKPDFDLDKLTMIGHSTGGDLCMFLATKYPHLVSNIISLDGRRCPFPRNSKCRILLLQASDTTTDEGVIPDKTESHQLIEMKIIKIDNALHGSYSDEGPDKIKTQVNSIVGTFLDHAGNAR